MRKIGILTVAVAALMAITVPAIAKPQHAEENHPEFWEAEFEGLECYKVDQGFGASYVTDKDYAAVIVKGGPGNEVYSPEVGDQLFAPQNPRTGDHYDISHIIFCEGDPLVS